MGFFSLFRRQSASSPTPTTPPPLPASSSKTSLSRRLSLARPPSTPPTTTTGGASVAPKLELPVLGSDGGVFGMLATGGGKEVEGRTEGEVKFTQEERRLLGGQRFGVEQARRGWEVVGGDLKALDLSSPLLFHDHFDGPGGIKGTLPSSATFRDLAALSGERQVQAQGTASPTSKGGKSLPTLETGKGGFESGIEPTGERLGEGLAGLFGGGGGDKSGNAAESLFPSSTTLRLAALFTLSCTPTLLPSLPSLSPLLPPLLPPSHDFSLDFADASTSVRSASELLEFLSWLMHRTDYAPTEGAGKATPADKAKEAGYREAVWKVVGMLVAHAPTNGVTLGRVSERWGWWVLGMASRRREGEAKKGVKGGGEEGVVREWEEAKGGMEKLFLAWLGDQAKIQAGLPLNLLNLIPTSTSSTTITSPPAVSNRAVLRIDVEAVMDPSEPVLSVSEILRGLLDAEFSPLAGDGQEKNWGWEAWAELKEAGGDGWDLADLLAPESYRLLSTRSTESKQDVTIKSGTPNTRASPSRTTSVPAPLEFRPFHTPSSSYFSLAASPTGGPSTLLTNGHSRKRSLTHDGTPAKPPSPKSPISSGLGSLREDGSASLRSVIPSWREFEESGFGGVGESVLGEGGGLKEPFELAVGRDGTTRKMTPRWAPVKPAGDASPSDQIEPLDTGKQKFPVQKDTPRGNVRYSVVAIRESELPAAFFAFYSALQEDQDLDLDLPEFALVALARHLKPSCNTLLVAVIRKTPPPPPINTTTSSAITVSPKTSPIALTGWKRSISGTAGKRNSFIRALSGELKAPKSGRGLVGRISEPVVAQVKKEIPFDPETVTKTKSRSSTAASTAAVVPLAISPASEAVPTSPSPDSSKSGLSPVLEATRSRSGSINSSRRKPVPEFENSDLAGTREESDAVEVIDDSAAPMSGEEGTTALAAALAEDHPVPTPVSSRAELPIEPTEVGNGFKRSMAPSPSPAQLPETLEAMHSDGADLAPVDANDDEGASLLVKVFFVDVGSFSPSDEVYEQLLGNLDQQSVDRIRRFHHRKDALRCLVGRLLPRWFLSSLPEDAFVSRGDRDDLVFDQTSTGKPYLAKPRLNPNFAFNVSHDQDLVVCAVGQGYEHVGVDVMGSSKVGSSADLEEALLEQLHPNELQRYHQSSPSARTENLLRTWTIKEAYTKALGVGLGMDFKRLAVKSDTSAELIVDDTPLSQAWHIESGSTGTDAPVREPAGYTWSIATQIAESDSPNRTTVQPTSLKVNTSTAWALSNLPKAATTESAPAHLVHNVTAAPSSSTDVVQPSKSPSGDQPLSAVAATNGVDHYSDKALPVVPIKSSDQPNDQPSGDTQSRPVFPSLSNHSSVRSVGSKKSSGALSTTSMTGNGQGIRKQLSSERGLSPGPSSPRKTPIPRKSSGGSGTSLVGIDYEGAVRPAPQIVPVGVSGSEEEVMMTSEGENVDGVAVEEDETASHTHVTDGLEAEAKVPAPSALPVPESTSTAVKVEE